MNATLAVVALAGALTAQTSSPTVLSAKALYARVSPSVVTVLAERGPGELTVGAGVLVHKDGWVVTAAHLVDHTDGALIVARDAPVESGVRARVVSLSRTEDIALVKLEGPLPKGVLAATLGSSDALAVGDALFAIGAPLGLRHTLSTGVVSAIRTDFGDAWSLGPRHVIQTDAAINQGNSGGPLFNAYGEVVGIASSIRTTAQDKGNIGLAFAVPSKTVRARLFEQPLPAIGVLLRRIPEPVGKALQWDIPGGALLVEHVVPGSPADAAGLHGGYVPSNLAGYELVLGGDVIVKVGPHSTQDAAQIASYLQMLKPGDKLTYTVVRASHVGTVDVTMPEQAKIPKLPPPPAHK